MNSIRHDGLRATRVPNGVSAMLSLLLAIALAIAAVCLHHTGAG